MVKEIFVFGSNLKGVHGAGSALHAKRFYGAKQGVGVGRTGDAYAIPTKKYPSMDKKAILPLTEIGDYVQEFKHYARKNKNLKFKVVRIGCGLAGYKDKEVAPLFSGSPENCVFDDAWKNYL